MGRSRFSYGRGVLRFRLGYWVGTRLSVQVPISVLITTSVDAIAATTTVLATVNVYTNPSAVQRRGARGQAQGTTARQLSAHSRTAPPL